MKKRNYRYNQHGGVDCEILFGGTEEIAAKEAVFEEVNGVNIQVAPAVEFVPAVEGHWVPHTLEEIPAGVDIAPYVESNKTKTELIALIAAKRYEMETGGIVRNGTVISTDRASQAMITGAYQALSSGLIQSTNWKNDDGSFTEVTFQSLKPIAALIAQHVAACFTAEMNHQIAISEIQDQTSLNNYDISLGWPT